MRFSFYIYFPVFFSLLFTKNSVLQNTNSPNNPYCQNISVSPNQDNKEDAIIGKWITVEKSVEIEVYKAANKFRARIIWFKIQDTTRPMNTRMDEKKPYPSLRTRKWLGMEVLRNLKYNAEDDEWQDGIIYEPRHGREWDSIAWINKAGFLKVKGYWLFKWISETLTFEKV